MLLTIQKANELIHRGTCLAIAAEDDNAVGIRGTRVVGAGP